MENKELKPCPFCKGQAEMKETPRIPSGTNYTPRCKHTWCCGRLNKTWARKEDAIRCWNRRADNGTK